MPLSRTFWATAFQGLLLGLLMGLFAGLVASGFSKVWDVCSKHFRRNATKSGFAVALDTEGDPTSI